MEDKVLKKREEIQEEDKWNVNEIYTSVMKFGKRNLKSLKEEAPSLKNFKENLGAGEKLLEYFEVK